MALSTAEKAKISRQFDFLTDPADAGQRQLVYDRLGLKSFEVAEAEAELRRTTKQGELSALGRQFGAPKQTTLGQEFTLPDMSRRTFSEGGDQRSIELPPLFTNEYSPFDQKKLERLYTSRSEFATDPELTDQERQGAFDAIDAKISAVPRISPMMKEPTAQQKFDAAIVTAPDGRTKGTFDPKTGKFIPLETNKARMELETERRKRKQTFLASIMKANDTAVEDGDPSRSFESMNSEAELQSQIEAGFVEPAGSMNPALDPTWQIYKSELDNQLNSKGRASEKQMLDTMGRYVEYAQAVNQISAAEAKHDFLQRWQKAIGDGDPIVAKMSPQTQRRMWSVAADTVDPQGTIRGSIPVIDGLRRGEGRVTVDGKTVSTLAAKPAPPGMEVIWPDLADDVKTDIQRLLLEGKTAPEILSKLKELGMI